MIPKYIKHLLFCHILKEIRNAIVLKELLVIPSIFNKFIYFYQKVNDFKKRKTERNVQQEAP